MNAVLKTLKVISINIFILLILLTILDLCYYKKTPPPIKRHILLKEIGVNVNRWQMPPDTYMKSTDGLEQKQYLTRTDHEGFVIGERNLYTKRDSVDIIFFGGSTTEALYVEESQRFPYLVQEQLSDLLGKDIITLNGGVSGGNSLHSTFSLLAKGIPKKPKVVILMHNINDLVGLYNTGSYYEVPYSRKPVQQTRNKSKGNFEQRALGLKDIFIPNLFPSIKKLLIFHCDTCTVDEWKEYRDVDSVSYSHVEYEIEKSILSFVRIAKSHDIKVILMTQFNRINMTDEFILKNNQKINQSFVNDYNKINEKIRQIAEREQIGLIDLANLVPSSNHYIYDAIHLNTNGSKYVASAITDYLIENNYLN